jgi:hypothetical protein
MMYISVGSTCNEGAEPNPGNAIIRATLDGKTRSVYASDCETPSSGHGIRKQANFGHG